MSPVRTPAMAKEDQVGSRLGLKFLPSLMEMNAIRMFDSCMAWLQEQDEEIAYELSLLCDLCEVAAKNCLSRVK